MVLLMVDKAWLDCKIILQLNVMNKKPKTTTKTSLDKLSCWCVTDAQTKIEFAGISCIFYAVFLHFVS